MGRQYYETRVSPRDFFNITTYSDKGKFAEFANKFDVVKELQLIDESFEVFKMWDFELGDEEFEVWIWDFDEDWKHKMIDNLVCSLLINDIEKMIADIGFRECCKIANDTGFCEDMTLEDLSTDMGMRKLFYCVLDCHLDCRADLDGEGYRQITEEDWEAWRERRDDGEESDHNSWSDHGESEDEEEDEDEIVPITDEALDRIGGKVAICA
jgi:hypothetical protein